MKFLEQLAKGFVRSAVNQVGRDGGRVVSNKVYGNAHATKIQVVGNEGDAPASASPATSFDLMSKDGNVIHFEADNPPGEEWIRRNAKPVIYETSVIMNGLMLIGSFFFPVLGPLYWLMKSAFSFFAKSVKYQAIAVVPNLVSDRRRKEGYRQDGYRKEVVVFDLEIGPLKSAFILKGVFCLLIGVATSVFQWIAYNALSN